MTKEMIISLAIKNIKKALENGATKEDLKLEYAEFLDNEEIKSILKN